MMIDAIQMPNIAGNSDMVAEPSASNLGVGMDYSSGAINYDAPGKTYRGLGADWFNKANIAKEDFLRNEIAKDNDYIRNEAAKVADYGRSREFRQTAYQDTVADMMKAGLNPVLAVSQGETSGSYSSSGYGSSGSRSGSGDPESGSFVSLVIGLAKIVAGAFSNNPGSIISGVKDVTISSKDSKAGTYVTSRTRSYSYKN